MEAAAVMHCGASLVLDCNKAAGRVQWTTRNCGRGEWTRLKTTTTEHSASSCSLRGKSELSFRSLILEGQTPYPRSPSFSAQSTRPAKSADYAFTDEKASLVEEEQILLLKKKAAEMVNDLRGSCVFLVGMMGSGKTTVGKYVADALGYYFFDSDKLVEDAAGGITVRQMFEEGSEEAFRNAESEVLMQLSSMGRLVVATGGGAVIRPQNWGYLRHGITVWLDVPVEALAKRVVAVLEEIAILIRKRRSSEVHSGSGRDCYLDKEKEEFVQECFES